MFRSTDQTDLLAEVNNGLHGDRQRVPFARHDIEKLTCAHG